VCARPEFAVVTGAALGEDPAVRLYRLLAVLAITAGLWAPRDAAAFCEVSGPYLGTGPKLPLGCPLHVYSAPRFDTPFMPRITVLRGGNYVDATGQIMSDSVQISVITTFVDCQLQPTHMAGSLNMFQHNSIVPQNVQVGELIGFGTGWFGGIEIAPAGTCAAPILPQPTCTEVPFCGGPPPFDDFEQSDCSASSGGGLAMGLLLLGLWAPRRRRR
jgi:MYXO-CTERM domain-containing protein